jgi:hypothetical protein
MEPSRRSQLVKQRAVAKGMLTRIQAFIETGDQKVNDIQVRFNKLSDIFCRYNTAQNELELSDDIDHSADQEQCETQYYQVEARFHELLYAVGEPPQSKLSSSQKFFKTFTCLTQFTSQQYSHKTASYFATNL